MDKTAFVFTSREGKCGHLGSVGVAGSGKSVGEGVPQHFWGRGWGKNAYWRFYPAPVLAFAQPSSPDQPTFPQKYSLFQKEIRADRGECAKYFYNAAVTERMKAKKSFGQHFLNKEDIASRIAQSLTQTDAYQQIIEIGPGKGMLTKHLLEQYTATHQLSVIEADRDMVDYLAEHYPALTPHVISEDFLKVKLSRLFEGPYAIIGNFPYNISSQILFKALDNREQVPELVGMFQKEVAERVVASPNTKAYGILSVLLQAYYDTEYLFTVGPEHFNPPPKVQSAVIRMVRKPDFDQTNYDESRFKAIVKTVFNTRRKMLRNSMKPFLPKNVIFGDEFFQQRPENLTVDDYIRLTQLSTEYNS